MVPHYLVKKTSDVWFQASRPPPLEMGHVTVKQAQVHMQCLTNEGGGCSGAQAEAPCNLTPAIAADSLAGDSVMLGKSMTP